MTSVVDRICTRHSVSAKYLGQPSPSFDELKEMARAAAAAPDHGRLGPMRLVYISQDDRKALAETFAAAALEAELQIDEAGLEAARARARRGACLLAVIATIVDDNPRIPPHEQWISVGAAVQNVLLSAESLGYRTKIVSGQRMGSRAMRSAFMLKQGEHLAAFVTIGTFQGSPKQTPRRSVDEILSIWQATNQ